MRYRFFREHKYLSFELFEVERFAAKTDFCDNSQVAKVKEKVSALQRLLKNHADWEDNSVHEFLRQKGSNIHDDIENDHHNNKASFDHLYELLEGCLNASLADEKLKSGYEFYLAFRLFASGTLKHLHKEETYLMEELHRLYTDEELLTLEYSAYHKMAPTQLIQMLETLFPHMDTSDYEDFLSNIKAADEEKFYQVWNKIKAGLKPEVCGFLVEKLSIKYNHTKEKCCA